MEPKKIHKIEVDDKVSQLHELIDTKGFNDAIKCMYDRVKAEEQVVEVNYSLKCFEHEGALAIFHAVKNVIGFCDITATEGASGDNPPELYNIKLPDGSEVQVPFGTVGLPTFDKDSSLEMDYNWNDNILNVTGNIKKKFEPQVSQIIKEAQRILDEESLYKGRAINLEFDDDDNQTYEPEFLDLSKIDESKILISKEAHDGLVPILARIKESERCVRENLDLKYGVLFEGPYGTGKTLIAFLIAKIAVENGWTFIYLKNCKHLAKTLEIAENYAKTTKGIVVFTEDIDQALRGNRDDAMQRILNTIDGGDTKNKPIISIFTTNHIELIEPTFLRGKRIGGLISLGALDKDTALQFINMLVVDNTGKSLIVDSQEERVAAADALVGIVPAFATEIIDRAKAYMIARNGKLINSSDIISAANSYRKQMSHAQLKKHDETEQLLASALRMVWGSMTNGKPPVIGK